MTGFAAYIKDKIAREGALPLETYMQLALTHPLYGYYIRRPSLGADFITAPEISQIFGELIGLWCVDCWHKMERPPVFILAELGSGRGTLMADAWRAAGQADAGFCAAARLFAVEASPAMREQTRARLPHAQFCPSFANLPSSSPLILVANEFFDALPVRQMVRQMVQNHKQGRRQWQERKVALDEASSALVLQPQTGAVRESSPAAESLIAAIAARCSVSSGAAIIIDFGADNSEGASLQAVRRHAFCPLLASPGESDLAARVDFAALARAARRAGIAIYGALPQGVFLANLGIAARARRLSENKPRQTREEIHLAVRRLIHPAHMGQVFKALALTSGFAPAGFAANPPA